MLLINLERLEIQYIASKPPEKKREGLRSLINPIWSRVGDKAHKERAWWTDTPICIYFHMK